MTTVVVTPETNLQAILDHIAPGTELVLEDGEYHGGLKGYKRPGRQDAPIVVRAANAGKVVVRGSGAVPHGIQLNGCPWWTIEGLRFRDAAGASIKVGISHHLTVRRVVCSQYGQGLMTGASSDGLVEDSEFSGSVIQIGIYISGNAHRWTVRRNRCYRNYTSGIQFNFQGQKMFQTGHVVEDNSIWGCGAGGGAGINLLGVDASLFQRNSIHDNEASGIALLGGRNNRFVENFVSFRAVGKSRQCIVTGGNSTLGYNYAVRNICRMGKPGIPAIQGSPNSVIVEEGNTVLPVATALTPDYVLPDTPTDGGPVVPV